LVDYGGILSLGFDKRDKNKIKFGKEKKEQAHFRKKIPPLPSFTHTHIHLSLHPYFLSFPHFPHFSFPLPYTHTPVKERAAV
jgi:hypothetical protein